MVYIMLADGFEETEALCPLDLLRRAGLEVRTVGVTGAQVKGSHGIIVTADILPDKINDKFELVIFPGGMPGSLNLDASPHTDHILKLAQKCGARIAAICAAPLILGRRGLLKGKRAICYPGYEKELLGAEISLNRVVTDGLFTTAIGMGAAAEFGFELIRLLCPEGVAEQIHDGAQFE